MPAGVYTITSPSGKQYVGSSVNIGHRLNTHRTQLRNQKHHSRILQNAHNKYGEDGLVFKPLLICAPEMLIFYEQRAIDVLKPAYNVRLIAESNAGLRPSAEHRAAISAASKGKKASPEARARMSAASKGKPRSPAQMEALRKGREKANSPEARAKGAEKIKLWAASPEGRATLSHNTKSYFETHGLNDAQREALAAGRLLKPKTASAETRAKISASKIASITPEYREKLRLAHLGKKHAPRSKEWREKHSIAMKNRPPISEETRAKMCAAAKIRAANMVRSDEWRAKVAAATKAGKAAAKLRKVALAAANTNELTEAA